MEGRGQKEDVQRTETGKDGLRTEKGWAEDRKRVYRGHKKYGQKQKWMDKGQLKDGQGIVKGWTEDRKRLAEDRKRMDRRQKKDGQKTEK